jgi:hypothetical protein
MLGVSVTISLLIMVINVLTSLFMRILVKLERYPTFTSYNKSLAWRLAFIQFFNSTFILLFSSYWVSRKNLFDIMWNDKGLANDAWIIMLTNVFVSPLLKIFNFGHFFGILERWRLKRQDKECRLT